MEVAMVVDVLVEIKARQIVQTFTYLLPLELEKTVTIGSRVLVPFNNRDLEGFVLKNINCKNNLNMF